MRVSTISQIGTFTALSPDAAPDWLRLDPARCSGTSDAPLRTTVEPAPGADGALVFPPLDDAQIVTLGGDLIITSVSGDPFYMDAVDALFAALKAALDALKAAPDSLVSNDGTVAVWKYAPLEPSWQNALMGVTFGLVVDVSA